MNGMGSDLIHRSSSVGAVVAGGARNGSQKKAKIDKPVTTSPPVAVGSGLAALLLLCCGYGY